ncbi:MAG: ChaN family lipoprotein [Myxococcota bacterium]
MEASHVLVGTIYGSGERRFLSPAELVGRLATDRFVLLGEKHDNPDHHRIQAWLLAELVAAGRHPGLLMEMLAPEQIPELRRARRERPRDVDHLARAIGWEASGWPEFRLYRPIFEIAVSADLSVGSANLSREERRGLRERGLEALETAFVLRFGLDEPLPPAVHDALAQEIRDAHCGYAPERAIERMILVQRARDARMAEVLLDLPDGDPGVLLAGGGHARRKGGVPVALAREADPERIVSVGLLEVERGETDPQAYLRGSFDYLWFTPRLDALDPCEKFREKLKQMR